MREILFRGKRVDDGEWAEGCLAAYNLIVPEYPDDVSNALGYYYNEAPFVGFIEVDPSTVGQYTGLTDKNGKKIFKGDILQIKDIFDKSVIWVIDYKRTAFVVNQVDANFSIYLGDFDNGKYGIEVIGNIHDNPELVEGACDND